MRLCSATDDSSAPGSQICRSTRDRGGGPTIERYPAQPSPSFRSASGCPLGILEFRRSLQHPEMAKLVVEASPKLAVHLGTHDRVQLLAHRFDHGPVTNVGQSALGTAPRHGVALGAPVASRPPPNCGHFGPVVTWLPIHLDRQLPAD